MTRWDVRTAHAGPVTKHRELFQCLSDGEMPKRALGASLGLHSILLTVLIEQEIHINHKMVRIGN